MTAVSNTPPERARKAYLTVLQRLQEPGTATAVAAAMGVSESTVSRLKNEQMEVLCGMLAHLGLKVVPVEMQCFHPIACRRYSRSPKRTLKASSKPSS